MLLQPGAANHAQPCFPQAKSLNLLIRLVLQVQQQNILDGAWKKAHSVA